jgi:hypothetical protein
MGAALPWAAKIKAAPTPISVFIPAKRMLEIAFLSGTKQYSVPGQTRMQIKSNNMCSGLSEEGQEPRIHLEEQR